MQKIVNPDLQEEKIILQSYRKALPLIFLVILLSIPDHAKAVLRPFLTTETAVPLERGETKLETGLRYERFSSSNKIYTLDAELTTGIINNLEFLVDVPFIFKRTEEDNVEGLGDLSLKAKLRFLKGREATPVSIAGQLIIKFPSGDRGSRLGTGEADVGLQLIATEEFPLITMHMNLGYTFVGNPPMQEFRDILNYSIAFEHEMIPDKLKLVGELTGHRQEDPTNSGDPLSLLAGIVHRLDKRVIIDGGVAIGLTSISPDYTINVGVTYNF